jgi:hypothetical protein
MTKEVGLLVKSLEQNFGRFPPTFVKTKKEKIFRHLCSITIGLAAVTPPKLSRIRDP